MSAKKYVTEEEKLIAVRERSRKWAAAHREQLREYNKKRYAAHREQAREQSRKWRAAHPERAMEMISDIDANNAVIDIKIEESSCDRTKEMLTRLKEANEAKKKRLQEDFGI